MLTEKIIVRQGKSSATGGCRERPWVGAVAEKENQRRNIYFGKGTSRRLRRGAISRGKLNASNLQTRDRKLGGEGKAEKTRLRGRELAKPVGE